MGLLGAASITRSISLHHSPPLDLVQSRRPVSAYRIKLVDWIPKMRKEATCAYSLWHRFSGAEKEAMSSSEPSSHGDPPPGQAHVLSPRGPRLSWQDASCIKMNCVWAAREMKAAATCC